MFIILNENMSKIPQQQQQQHFPDNGNKMKIFNNQPYELYTVITVSCEEDTHIYTHFRVRVGD